MKGPLDPAIGEMLEALARRRRRLLLLRGACAAVAILLAAMTAAVAVDGLAVLPDPARWALSGAAYAAALAGLWATCARLFLRPPDARELARWVERCRPDLREDLLSAVELGEGRGDWDSPEFRRLLQEDVARRIADVRPEELLPSRRVAGWVRAAVVMLAGCAALFLVPGLRFEHRLRRSLLPLANLERVSSLRVEVVEPDPNDRVVPQGDAVTIAARVAGGRDPGRAVLEFFPRGGPSRSLEMRRAGDRYEADLEVARAPLEYRVRAGDAVTRRFRLTPRPRPEVDRFRVTYRLPDYAGLPPREEARETGDLEALEGTQAALVLEVNQEIRAGTLEVEAGGKRSSIPLRPAGPLLLAADLAVIASGTYRVELVAAETGFENRFSPRYEIRARADLVPRVSIEEPKHDLVVPPDEVVALRGTARDDLGLARVAQAVRVNQAEWVETTLAERPGAHQAVALRWDLLPLKLQPGDRVATRLVATDLKGNRAESAPLHVFVSAPGFDPRRLAPLEAKRGVLAALAALRDGAREFDRRVQESVPAAAAAGDLWRGQALLALLSEEQKLARLAEVAEHRLREAAGISRGGREAHDLVLEGIVVRRLREEAAPGARAEFERALAAAPAAREPFLARVQAHAKRAAELAQAAADSWRDLLAGEEAMALWGDLADLARDEAAMNAQASAGAQEKDPGAWERLARRQGVATTQARSVEELIRLLLERAPEGKDRRLDRLRLDLEARRTALEAALTAPAGPELAAPSVALEKEVAAALAAFPPIEQESARRAERARESLARRAGASFQDAQAFRRELEAAAEMEARGGAGLDAGARARERGLAAAAQLEARAGLEELRRDSDPFFVADAALAARALRSILEASPRARGTAQAAATARDVEGAFRTLEAGHRLAEAALALRELADGERWSRPGLDAAARHPKDWEWVEGRLRGVAEELREAGLPAEAVRDAGRVGRGAEAERVRREMAERAAPGRAPVRVAESVERLGADLQRALALAQPSLDRARATLLRLVPTLAERLAELARSAERMQQATGALAVRTPAEDPAQVRQEARRLLGAQQELDLGVDEAVAMLRRDAAVQDLFTQEGRERARDADDALAMLAESAPEAEDLLAEAASGAPREAQAHALGRAADQQGRMVRALRALAEHYRGLEAGRAEETRSALRAAEEAMGLKPVMEARYGQMKSLADVRGKLPPELMAALEASLAASEAMQKEVEGLAREALDRAEAALAHAAGQEGRASETLERMEAEETKASAALRDTARRVSAEARKQGLKRPAAALEASPSPAAADQVAEAARRAADQARQKGNIEAAGKAAALSGQARELADLMRERGATGAARLGEAAAQQGPIRDLVDLAGDDVLRAARLESRLGKPEGAQELERVGLAVEGLASKDLPAARDAVAKAAGAAQARPAVAAAKEAVEAQRAALARARQGAAHGAGGAEEGALSEEAAALLARAMESLDAAMEGQAGRAGEAAQAMTGAARAQSAAMRDARLPGGGGSTGGRGSGGSPGRGSGSGARTGDLLRDPLLRRGSDWGRLPAQIARDLVEGARENVSEEYRLMVETYFRVVAERAKK